MTAEQQLPKGWKKYNLFDICQPKQWKTIAVKDLINEGYPVYGANGIIGYYHEYNHDVATVLLTCRGATCGEVHISKPYSYINGNAMCMDNLSDNTITEFLYYYLKSINLNFIISGSAQPQITQIGLRKVEIPIPPLETQQAIVNKIESLFDEIDEGIGRLKTAAQQIQQYRQSLLKNAFNGELTKEWRSKHADALPSENELLAQIQTTREQYHAQQLDDWQTAVSQWEQNGKEGKKPSKPKAPTQAVKFEENVTDLPSGWGAIKINQVAEIFTGATPLKSNANYYENGSIPWVTSGSLNNEFVDSADSFVTDLALKETNLKLLPKHTLLIAMYGEGKTRGKCSELLIEATTNQAIAGIVLNEKYPISRKFLKFYMFKNYADIRRQSSGGVQPNLNLSLVGNIIFPLPCLAEQTQIVAMLESKLTACDQLAAELAKQLKQAELLKQAVLKAAFSGSLLDK
ncbi:restriction endonuclease subunit S [Haemophilus haemolyticus]|uniref:restriction endonuclease subunit S n=1 Tax=Haemophilus haemolyticus TaxID=726 RepID=UPI001CC77510|nr:restriction endonuclease subunit S [Haemophilus haemolyticus]